MVLLSLVSPTGTLETMWSSLSPSSLLLSPDDGELEAQNVKIMGWAKNHFLGTAVS